VRRALPALLLACACVKVPYQRADAMSAEPVEKLGEDRLALKWKFVAADRLGEISPQEFAAPAVIGDTVYIGSATGTMYALRASSGRVRWKRKVGPVMAAPLVVGPMLYVGTGDGFIVALDSETGKVKWKYQGRGGIAQTPVTTGELVIFSNEADQVVALDAVTGKFKWQFKSETPEEYTLRGHAGVALDGEFVYTGFSNGSLVALRRDTGSVAWSTSLKGDADRFVDVDGTPIVVGSLLYVTSASGGVHAVDKQTGLVRWRVPFWDAALPSSTGNVGGITTDGTTLYASVADLGTYAIDMEGNVLWRVGAHRGGEPATPVIFEDLLVYSLATDGLFVADRRTGETLEYFDPGDGVSAPPTVTADGRLFVMSNRGVLYAFDLD
jgi:outer membrane protein assembly factor BamB